MSVHDKFAITLIFSRLHFHLADIGFKVEFNTPQYAFPSRLEPDLFLSRGSHKYAAVYAQQEDEKKWLDDKESQDPLQGQSIRFVIFPNTDKSFKIYDLEGQIAAKGEGRVVDIDDLKDIFSNLENKEYHFSQNVADKFSKEFLRIAQEIRDRYGENWDYTYRELLDFEDETCFDSLVADDYGCYFKDPDIEDGIFYYLICDIGSGYYCRYTSLRSLFRTLHEGQQGMYCLVGMNDKSETNYVESYLGLNQDDNIYNAEVENRFFILSLLPDDKYDDLTMWRLYGDNTQGVCIKYDYDLDDSDLLPDGRLTLLHTDYGIDKDHHPALDFLKELLDVEIEGKKFRLRRLNEWKHFFKSYEYKDEDEVRLLYKAKKNEKNSKWVLTSDYNIVTPIKMFSLDDFPLKIKSITLGPNCPSKEVNFLQLKEMITHSDIPLSKEHDKDIVKISNCLSYRK